MNELVIGLFETRAEVPDPAGESRVRRLADEVARGALDRAFEAAALPDGLWCLRRLDVEISLDNRTDRELGRTWAETVVTALLHDVGETRLTTPGRWSGTDADLAGYARSDEVVTDLVASLAAGRREREWAWRALGVLSSQDPGPAHDPRGAALAALRRSAEAAVPVVAAAVAAAGLAAVHRLLGTPGWRAVAALVLRHRGLDPGAWLSPPATRTATAADVRAAQSVVTRSALARALRSSGLRLDPGAVAALAVLAVAEAEPALLHRSGAATAVRATAGLAAPDGPAEAGLVLTARPATGLPSVADGSARSEAAGGSPGTEAPGREGGRGGSPAERQDPDAGMAGDRAAADEDGRATRLGGLVYLLATAEAAGVPDDLLADPALEHVPPSEVLHHLWLAVAGDDGDRPPGAARSAACDQAVAALSGRAADDPPPGPVPDDARAAVERYAARWRQETAGRLDAAGAGMPVTALVRRQGRVARWPGWTEFRLSLADVDVGVRRAGLDLDPGFVPWLGAVVVIRYG